MVTILMGYRNGRRSFDFFRFLRVDRQNLCWACVIEGVPGKLDVGG